MRDPVKPCFGLLKIQIKFKINLRYYINTLKQELSTAKIYEHNRLDETSIVDRHRCHMAAMFELFADEDHSKLPTLYWLPKLHNWPFSHVLLLVHVQLLSCLFF